MGVHGLRKLVVVADGVKVVNGGPRPVRVTTMIWSVTGGCVSRRRTAGSGAVCEFEWPRGQ